MLKRIASRVRKAARTARMPKRDLDFIFAHSKSDFRKRTAYGRPIAEQTARYNARIEAIRMACQEFIDKGTMTASLGKSISNAAYNKSLDTTKLGPKDRQKIIDTEIARLEERVRDFQRLGKAWTKKGYAQILSEMFQKDPKTIHKKS